MEDTALGVAEREPAGWNGLLWEAGAAIAVCELVGAVGALSNRDAFRSWYPSLRKPAFTPPDAVFGPVWTVLYAMLGLVFALVRRRGRAADTRPAQALFALQLALNAAWTPLFFGRRSPALGLADILLLWGALVLTLRAVGRVSRPAGALLLPYLLWVSFAATLNAAIWWLNRGRTDGAATVPER